MRPRRIFLRESWFSSNQSTRLWPKFSRKIKITEFLNSFKLPGLSPNNLRSVVIMLRSIYPPGLCNWTRLSEKDNNNVIEVTILKGKFKGEDVLTSSISTDLPFDFKHFQFPAHMAFAIIINKSQGQTLEVLWDWLEFPCFAYGQLYEAYPHVGNLSLFIYAPQKKTKIIVYQKPLN